MEQRPQFCGTIGAEHDLEPGLRLDPTLDRGAQALCAGLGHPQFLAAAVGLPLDDSDQALALQGQDVSPDCRPIITRSAASALIVIGPQRFSFARIENWVVRSPLGARCWS